MVGQIVGGLPTQDLSGPTRLARSHLRSGHLRQDRCCFFRPVCQLTTTVIGAVADCSSWTGIKNRPSLLTVETSYCGRLLSASHAELLVSCRSFQQTGEVARPPVVGLMLRPSGTARSVSNVSRSTAMLGGRSAGSLDRHSRTNRSRPAGMGWGTRSEGRSGSACST
jgi:hypothetical protein